MLKKHFGLKVPVFRPVSEELLLEVQAEFLLKEIKEDVVFSWIDCVYSVWKTKFRTLKKKTYCKQ